MNEKINIENIASSTIWDSEKYIQLLVDFSASFIPKILGALIVLWIGFKVINILNKAMHKIMKKAKWDPMLESFILSLTSIVLKILVFISAAWVMWVETSSFVAMLAAAGLAIGMALSGTLQNFAWGVMILIFKPYKLWDFIEAGWHAGTVEEIHIFNTILLSGDKKTIIIPNSDISNWSMINYSTQPKRRLDLQVWISYSDDIDLTKNTLEQIAKSDQRILTDDGITIAIAELWDNAVIFNFRVFVNSADYWSVRWDLLENIKKTFDAKWISFPFPQRDVHIYNQK